MTIIGPGGMGKSRLSIEAARRQIDNFADGVAFVPLAPVNPADLAGSIDSLETALADALKLAYRAGSPPLTQLLDFLQPKQILLVLDNFEHLLASVTVVAAILNSTSQVKLVVTSRERLNLPQEWLFPLQGLTFPESSSQASGNVEEAVEAYSALQLFDQRARQAQPNFDLLPEHTHVSHICQLVEGLPLGIELAAAWVRLMPCQTIVAEIQKSIDFLATTMRTIPDRHRSLRAVFEHSWQLLSEPEQAVLRKLSIFRGGFEQAKAVFPESLSLLQRSEGDTRYDTALNQFYYGVTLYLGGEYVAATPVAQQALVGFKALGDYWGSGKSLMILGQIGHHHGQYVEEERFSQESIATLEKIGNRRFTAYAISNLGRVALALGKYEQAETYHQDCLQRRTELGDQGGLAFTLKDLGNLSLAQRQLDRAKDFYQQSLAIAEKIDSTYSKIQALWGMGKSAHALGNYAEAKAFFQESLILNSKRVVPELIPLYRADLGWTTLALAEYQETEQYFTRTMRAAVDNQAFPVILDAIATMLRLSEITNSIRFIHRIRRMPKLRFIETSVQTTLS